MTDKENFLKSLTLGDEKFQVAVDLLQKKPVLINQITALDLTCRKLMFVPKFIGQLTQLQELDLRYNKIVSIPEFMTQMPELEILYLGGNKLTSIPEFIAKIPKLRYLDLVDNKIAEAERIKINELLPNCKVVYKIN